MTQLLKDMLVRHENIKLRLYKDSKGILTIGVGRNIQDRGISRDEAMLMLDNDIFSHSLDAQKIPVFVKLDPVRQDVLIDMVFNMGLQKVLAFKKTLAALEAGDWKLASTEMKDSDWATQVGNRALELSKMIETGAYQIEGG